MHLEEIRDYWNSRANGFSRAVNEELETEEKNRWEKIFRKNLKEGSLVLDLGTGAGFFPVILSALGHQVTAVDYSEEMTERAKERFSALSLSVRTLQMDAQELSFEDQSFDAVVTRNVLWNLDHPDRALSEAFRVLKPGGTLILEDGNMYLYLYQDEYAELHRKRVEEAKKKGQAEGGLHGKHNVDNVDFSIIENIARDLPMSRVQRPQWDFDQLVRLGFDRIQVEIHGNPLPMGFLITARKTSAVH